MQFSLIFLAAAAWLYGDQVNACLHRKVPPLSTLENPPGNEVSGSAWDLPEVEAKLQATKGKKVPFNTRDRERFLWW